MVLIELTDERLWIIQCILNGPAHSSHKRWLLATKMSQQIFFLSLSLNSAWMYEAKFLFCLQFKMRLLNCRRNKCKPFSPSLSHGVHFFEVSEFTSVVKFTILTLDSCQLAVNSLLLYKTTNFLSYPYILWIIKFKYDVNPMRLP